MYLDRKDLNLVLHKMHFAILLFMTFHAESVVFYKGRLTGAVGLLLWSTMSSRG